MKSLKKVIMSMRGDKYIEREYLKVGAKFGFVVNLLPLSKCEGFESQLDKLNELEKEYSSRGYRTIPIRAFISLGAYNKNIDHLLGKKRGKNERPIYNAETYKKSLLY